MAGTEEQKQKYLSKIASGELKTALCFAEPNSHEDSFQVVAEQTAESKGYYLTGKMNFIHTGPTIDLMVVLAFIKVSLLSNS